MNKIKKASMRQEKATAEIFGGKPVVASGALWFSKGDVKTDEFLIENKMTKNSYYSLKFSLWEKIKKEAVKSNLRTPLMVIMLGSGKTFVVFEGFEHSYQEVTVKGKSFRITGDIIKENYEDEALCLNFLEYNTKLFIMLQRDFLYYIGRK